jgi:demethylmenaquinone methyltransferase/2-methoxy-6-polyprenyl-1,4-benzoquinol methylase
MALECGAEVVALDFADAMLRVAQDRVPAADKVRGDALNLPLASGSVTVVVSGFALRNFVSLPPAFQEAARILAPGGRIGLLEVDQPSNRAVRSAHSIYFDQVVPRIGGFLSRDPEAYRYLPESAVYLPTQDELVRMLKDAGFRRIVKRRHMFGAIQAVTAVKV